MRIATRMGIAMCVAVATASCSLFTSLGGLSSDADEPAGGDASADATGSADADGGAANGDAAADGPFCASIDASFCDDFDDPSDTTFRNWVVETETGGTVARAGGGYSAPNALESTVVDMGDVQVPARLEKTFPLAKRLRVVYKFRLVEHELDALVTFAQMTVITDSGARSSVRLAIGGGKAKFEGAIYPTPASGTFPQVTPNFGLTDAQWHSVDMTCDWEAKPATVSLTYDGTRIADREAMLGSDFGPGKLTVTTGIFYREGGSTPWRVLFDDVAFWVE